MAKKKTTHVTFETYLRECDICKVRNLKSEALSYCRTCNEYLCVSCDNAHKGSVASRDHEILMWSKLPAIPKSKTPSAPTMLCDIHTTMKLDLYCKDHEDVICVNCKTINHKDCFTSNIGFEADRSDETFSKTMKKLVKMKRQCEDLKEARQSNKVTLVRKIETCLNDMKMIRREINRILDRLESYVVAEIKEYEDKMSDEIANHMNVADDMLVQLNTHIKSMKGFQKTRNDDVMFVGMTKIRQQVCDCENQITDIQNENLTVDISFKTSEIVTDMIQQINSIGTVIVPNKPERHGQSSVLNISIVDKTTVDIGARDIRGCTFLPDGHFVLACFTDGVKVYNKNLEFQDELYVPSADIATYNDTNVIITQRNLKQLQVIRILPKMAVERKVKIGRICCGVDVFGDQIYVTCHDSPGNGEVQVLSKAGKLQRRLGFDNDKYMFTRPLAVKISRDGTKIFVSDSDTCIVTCLDQKGHVVYRYSDAELNRPTGLFVDADDNLLVCAWRSNNVHIVRKDGKKQMVVLTEDDGIRNPLCVAYRQSSGILVVGLDNRAITANALVVIKTQ